MSSPIITKVVEEMNDLPNDLPDDLQHQILQFATTLRQQHLQSSGNAWNVLESLTGTVETLANWSAEHDYYLYDTPKHQETES